MLNPHHREIILNPLIILLFLLLFLFLPLLLNHLPQSKVELQRLEGRDKLVTLITATAIEVPHHVHRQHRVFQGEKVREDLAWEDKPDEVPRGLRDKLQLV